MLEALNIELTGYVDNFVTINSIISFQKKIPVTNMTWISYVKNKEKKNKYFKQNILT